MEFVIENGKLFILSTQTADLSAVASVNIAVSMVKQEKVLTEREALMRINAYKMDYFTHPTVDLDFKSINMQKSIIFFITITIIIRLHWPWASFFCRHSFWDNCLFFGKIERIQKKRR
jgi:hypothetical protein